MKQPRWLFISILLAAAAMLYLAGVFSGLYANNILAEQTEGQIQSIQHRTEQDLNVLRSGTRDQIANLSSYISFLDRRIGSLQLEQLFLDTLTVEERCNFSNVSMQYLLEDLQFYRERLPFRIELYEKQPELPEEYIRLKEQYNTLSIRTWILARDLAQECSTPLSYGLYFYSRDCDDCVAQGEQLDIVTDTLSLENRSMMLFTIDYNAEDLIIAYLKEYYHLNNTPSIILNDIVFHNYTKASQLLEAT